MLNVEQLRDRLNDLPAPQNIHRVADAIGLHHSVVRRIANGAIKDPRFSTVAKINEYFSSEQAENTHADQ